MPPDYSKYLILILYTITYNRQLTEEDKNKTFNKPKEEEYNKKQEMRGKAR